MIILRNKQNYEERAHQMFAVNPPPTNLGVEEPRCTYIEGFKPAGLSWRFEVGRGVQIGGWNFGATSETKKAQQKPTKFKFFSDRGLPRLKQGVFNLWNQILDQFSGELFRSKVL